MTTMIWGVSRRAAVRALFASQQMLCGVCLIVLAAAPTFAQGLLRGPSDTRPPLPAFVPETSEPTRILPPVPQSLLADAKNTAADSVVLEEIAVDGNTVMSDEAINALAKPYFGNPVQVSDLLALRDRITLAYVERGYVTSGATIPPQSLDRGVLRVQVVEGRLAEIDVSTDGRFRPARAQSYLHGFGSFDPINVIDIERRLQLVQQAALIDRVDAELRPGVEVGESVISVDVTEADAFHAFAEVSNYEAPSIGSWRGFVDLRHLNLTGNGDELGLSSRASEGLTEFSGEYRFGINSVGSSLSLYFLTADSEIVEAPFESLNIEAESRTYGVRFQTPIRREVRGNANLFAAFELRRSESFLLGSGFSFSPGPEQGVAKIAVIRGGGDYVWRSRSRVLAGRLAVSAGVDAFDATKSSGKAPDGQFFSGLVQLQWAERLEAIRSQLIGRFDVQVASKALLGMEQLAIGGRATVRGYRENTLVRDNGAIGSLEWRIAVLRRANGNPVLEISPFADWSYSWNNDREEVGPQTISGVGLGLRWQPVDKLLVSAYWGESINNINYPGEYDLQNDGIHLGISYGLSL